MNKTVELVNHWGEFEQKHPEGNIEDFCRYHLAHQQYRADEGILVGGVVPSFDDGLLMKIVGRISKLNMAYANIALKGTGLNQIEEFGMLMTIRKQGNPRKTDVINANLFELSSGTDMLNRMKKRGLIKEYGDQEDKRSKRIELTALGEQVAVECSGRIGKNAKMLMAQLDNEDKALCIQILKDVEIKLSATWPKHRNKEFQEIYDELMGEIPG
jgi:DNA-binding MarR family transcriptional regulator